MPHYVQGVVDSFTDQKNDKQEVSKFIWILDRKENGGPGTIKIKVPKDYKEPLPEVGKAYWLQVAPKAWQMDGRYGVSYRLVKILEGGKK